MGFKRHIADILSICNLICGILGCITVIIPNRPAFLAWADRMDLAFFFVFLGQFFDLFDGRAAGYFGSTAWGEIYDDVADGTSFGICIALIAFRSFSQPVLGVIAAITYAFCTIYRLVRFVVRKHQTGQQGGVSFFSGLPSPAAALLAGTAAIVYPRNHLWDAIKFGTVVASALLEVSYIVYPHGGRYIARHTPQWLTRACGITMLFLIIASFSGMASEDGSITLRPVVIACHTVGLLYAISPAVVDWRIAQDIEATLSGEVSEEAMAEEASGLADLMSSKR